MKRLEKAAIWLTALIVGVAFFAAAMLLALAHTYPHRPRTALGWLLFVAAVPVGWIASEAFDAWLDREPAGRWVDRRTADKGFSWVRVLYLLLRTLLVLAVIMGTLWMGGSYFPALRDLVSRHFGPGL